MKKQTININTEYQQQLCFEYSEQPENLKALLSELEIEVTFNGLEKHFPDDKEKREVLTVFIKRGSQEINFNFGLSLIDTARINIIEGLGALKDYSLLVKEELKNKALSARGFKGYDKYFYTLFNINNIYKVLNLGGYSLKPGVKSEILKPLNLLYSILSCCSIDYYCPIDFEEFCFDFGYSTDSIKAKITWESCLKQSAKLQRIFIDSEIETLPQ